MRDRLSPWILALPLSVTLILAAARVHALDGDGDAPQAANNSLCQPRSGLSTCIDSDNLWPRPGRGPLFSVAPTMTTSTDSLSFGLVASYLSRPIGLRVASPDPEGTEIHAVDNVIDATFLWALGITNRFELTLALPVTIYQNGAGLGDVLGSRTALPQTGLRDARMGFALSLLARPSTKVSEGAAVTSRFEFTIPFGDKDAFAGGTTTTFVPSVVADYRYDRIGVAAEAGARIRGESEFASARVGSQLSLAAGTWVDVLDDAYLTISAEAFALYTLASQEPPTHAAAEFTNGPGLVPAEWIVSANTAPLLCGDIQFAAGGGGPIPFADESAITAPRFRFNLAIRYAPLGPDADTCDDPANHVARTASRPWFVGARDATD